MTDERHIGGELMTLSNRFRRYMDNNCSKFGITRMQSLVLRHMEKCEERGEGVYQKNIEKAFCIRRSTASSLLSLMEIGGLIDRDYSSADGRVKQIVFTDKGREIQKGMHSSVVRGEEEISALLTPEERETLFRVTDKLNAYFINEENK